MNLDNKKNPLKNYIIFAIVAMLSFIFVFNLSNWYLKNTTYTTNITKTIAEVMPLELENYLIENDNIIIYVSSSSDKNLEIFEKDLANYFINNQLESNIIYYDYDKDDNNNFKKVLNVDLTYPNLYAIKNHKFDKSLYIAKNDSSIESFKNFIESFEKEELND